MTFTATVTPGSGTFDKAARCSSSSTAATSAPVTVSSGSATINDAALSVGTHTVVANYSGDSNFTASSGTLSGGQTVNQATTTTTVTSSVNPSTFGQTVTFTATVTPGSGMRRGTVQFVIDGSNFGSPVTVSSGTAHDQ